METDESSVSIKVLLVPTQDSDTGIANVIITITLAVNAHQIAAIQPVRQSRGNVDIENAPIDADINLVITVISLCHNARIGAIGTITVTGTIEEDPDGSVPKISATVPVVVAMVMPIPVSSTPDITMSAMPVGIIIAISDEGNTYMGISKEDP
jgi:hypothetical protein